MSRKLESHKKHQRGIYIGLGSIVGPIPFFSSFSYFLPRYRTFLFLSLYQPVALCLYPLPVSHSCVFLRYSAETFLPIDTMDTTRISLQRMSDQEGISTEEKSPHFLYPHLLHTHSQRHKEQIRALGEGMIYSPLSSVSLKKPNTFYFYPSPDVYLPILPATLPDRVYLHWENPS